jgi:hypothetical protein
MQANLAQIGAAIVDAGLITAGELAIARRLVRDPAFIANYPLLITAWGRKPLSGGLGCLWRVRAC